MAKNVRPGDRNIECLGASVWCLLISCLLVVAAACGQPSSRLTLRSSSSFMEGSFARAKDKALGCVRTGRRPDYIPSYFAAMSEQFCLRDVAHMMEGAHLLGLDIENWSMMHLFAWGANRRVKQDYHWPRWHYPYTGKTDEDFGSCQWRTLPAPFDMAWRCYEQYLWTGDDKWINDPEMFTYYTNLHTKFMEHQNWDHDPVADEMRQLASYFEFPKAGVHFIEAGDAIGCQYQAILAYSAILKQRGDAPAAQIYCDKAKRLRAHFETYWFDKNAGRYIRGFDRFSDFRSDWGRENSFFLPMTLITDQGPRTAAYLDFIDASITEDPLNIEAYTYIPEVFYKHGRSETAWKYLKLVLKSQSNYPEVPFTCVGNTISGMMGVWPDAPNKTVSTLPRLPGEITWVEADHVPVGSSDLLVRHDGNHKTTLRNNSGPTLTWDVRFYGNYSQLLVDRVVRKATVTALHGRTISCATVPVAPGRTVVVETYGSPKPDLPAPPAPELSPRTPLPPAPAPGVCYLSDMKWRYGSSMRDGAIKLNAGRDGNPIKIGGVTYAKGIGVGVGAAIRYDLHRQYSRFLCDIGFDGDPAQDTGSAEFVVYGGSQVSSLLYTSGVLYARMGPGRRHINIDVGDCEYIVLGVKDAHDGRGRNNRLNWADARLIAKGGTSDTQPPTAPENLRVTRAYHNSVQLAWTASTDNVTVRGYDIYCGTVNMGSTTSTDFRVTGLSANTSYSFAVKAWDADGNTSAASSTAMVTTPLAPDCAYLSELNWQSATTSYGGIGKDRSVDGKPIRLNGVLYPRGIGTHAESTILYDLNKLGRPYARFVSNVGIDDEISAMATVVFQVYADGKKVFDSGVMRPADATKTVDISVAGVRQLKLVVTDGGDGINSDHADWADARLITKPEGSQIKNQPQ